MSLNSWGDYDDDSGMVGRLPTRYERERAQSARELWRDRTCKAIIIACGLVLAAVLAAGQ